MDGDTLQKETLMCLTGGLAFLDTIPNSLPQNIVQSRNQMRHAFQDVLNKWVRVKSIVPEIIGEVPQPKAGKTLRKVSSKTTGLMKKRSNSAADLYAVGVQSESPYINLTSSLSVCNKSASKQTRKRSIYKYISFRTTSKVTQNFVPSVSDTLVQKECDINPHVVTEFTMRSDGRFSMLIDGVSLQSGNRKLVEKDLYCCLQHHFVLFGPKLTNVPPLKVLNLEDCMLVKTTKKELHIKDGNEDHTIRYSSEEQAKQWAEKIREISPYTYIPDCKMNYLNEPEKNYSYVRQERFIGNKCSDYEYINKICCLDCDGSVHKKTSTAEAIIDKSYINLASSITNECNEKLICGRGATAVDVEEEVD